MAQRKRKKKDKLRGNRSHGKGNTKNKRGAGCRGGRGRAGSHKHKYSKYYAEFGQKKRLKPKNTSAAVNLAELNGMIEGLLREGLVKKEGNTILIEAGNFPFDKITGRGTPTVKLEIRGVKASKKAIERIEAVGGSVQATEETEEVEAEANEKETVEKKETGGDEGK